MDDDLDIYDGLPGEEDAAFGLVVERFGQEKIADVRTLPLLVGAWAPMHRHACDQ